MLSVLVPVYNFAVEDFIKKLNNQCKKLNIDYEIIIIDDSSEPEIQQKNKNLSKLTSVKYSIEKTNIGRSKIRNKLAKLAKYDNLLFLDCDSEINDGKFIERYLKYCNKNVVVCGGRKYLNNDYQNKNFYLHWLHGKYREEIDVLTRKEKPNKSFMSNNFLIPKRIFNNIRFDENITKYGHEDTLFGYELKENNITIKHIHNPLIHIGLEGNEEFLNKTLAGIDNLFYILKVNGHAPSLVKDIKLLKYYKILEGIYCKKLVAGMYHLSNKLLRRRLVTKPRLWLYDIFKIGYLCTL